MPNANLSAVAVVLDRSGSMMNVREATIAGLNTFFRTQRETPGDVRLTLAQFDDIYEVKADFVDLKTFPDLTQEDFVPRGWTALLDGIGKTIIDLGVKLDAMAEADRPGKVVVVVQTDGGENSSHEFTLGRIQRLIREQTAKYNWEFVFLGANQDAIAVGGTMGISAASSLSYNNNALSTAKTFQTVGASISSSRVLRSHGIGGQSVSFNAAARDYVADDTVQLDPNANFVDPTGLSGVGVAGLGGGVPPVDPDPNTP